MQTTEIKLSAKINLLKKVIKMDRLILRYSTLLRLFEGWYRLSVFLPVIAKSYREIIMLDSFIITKDFIYITCLSRKK